MSLRNITRDEMIEMYWGENMTQEEIGDNYDVTQAAVSAMMQRMDIKTEPIRLLQGTGGYECINAGEYGTFGLHRLLAVHKYGFDEVCGVDVHHKNGIPWDNRIDNIELLSQEEHMGLHALEMHDHEEAPWRDIGVLKEMLSSGMTQEEIADELRCSVGTIRNWLEKHNINDDKRFRNDITPEEVQTMYQNGMSQYDIADELNCSRLTVRKRLANEDE